MGRISLLVCTLLLFESRLVAAQSCGFSQNDVPTEVQKLYKKTVVETAKNPAEFCKRNALIEFLSSAAQAPANEESYSALSTKELEKKADEKLALTNSYRDAHFSSTHGSKTPEGIRNQDAFEFTNDAWRVSLIPTASARAQSYETAVGWVRSSNQMDVRKLLEKPVPMGPPVKNIIKKNLDLLRKSAADDSSENSALTRVVACADLSLNESLACGQALKKEIPRIIPVGADHGTGTRFNNLEDWQSLMLDDRYDEGLRETAILLSNRVSQNKITPANANVFADLKASFRNTKMSESEASHAALLTLGVIANGGSGMATRLGQLEISGSDGIAKAENASQKRVSLTVIAAALPVLDQIQSETQQPLYSMPSNVNSRCDNSKSYHFWMIARVAQRMVEEDHVSASVASKAAFTIEKAYHIKRELGRPDSIKDQFTGQGAIERLPFSAPSNLDRGDLSFASAGAAFGAYFGQRDQLNLNSDSSLPLLIEASKPAQAAGALAALPNIDAVKFLRWSNIFSPNTAYENMKSATDRSLQGR